MKIERLIEILIEVNYELCVYLYFLFKIVKIEKKWCKYYVLVYICFYCNVLLILCFVFSDFIIVIFVEFLFL